MTLSFRPAGALPVLRPAAYNLKSGVNKRLYCRRSVFAPWVEKVEATPELEFPARQNRHEPDHKQTEALLRDSGIDHVLLRNGWYTENYLVGVPAALQHGAVLGAAGNGRIASASRADYAAAAAVVLTSENQAGKVYELAGDTAYTLASFAEELSRQSKQPVDYRNLSEDDFKAALLQIGLPQEVATLVAESDAGAAKGGLFDDGHQLSRLIGRPTTSLAQLLAARA